MYNYYALKNKFYPTHLRGEYKKNGMWPTDCIDIDDSVFTEFTVVPPTNQMRIPGDNGLPVWGDIPQPTHEEQTEIAEQYRQQRLQQIDEVTVDWRVELMLGDISDEDKERLSEWMAYKKAVKAVDVSTAPDVIWPTSPEG
ncbi:TPA: tail fiber assembly protein [Escherichia coli]